MSDNRDDFRKKILSVFLFFLVFGLAAYALVFFTGKSSAPQTAETVKPRENRDAMTDPASGSALTYSLSTDGEVSVREGAAAEKPASEEPAGKKLEPVKEQPVKQPEPKAAPASEKKAEAPKPAPKPAKPQTPAPKPAETKTPAPAPAPAAKPAKPNAGMFVIQLAAYRTEDAADAEMNRLRKNFPDIYSVRIDLGEKGVWYRLRTSPSATQAEAIKKRDAINAKYGFKAIVVKSE